MRLVILILGVALVSTFFLTESSLILTREQVERDQTTILRNTAGRMAFNLRNDLSARADEVQFFAELPILEEGELSNDEIRELLSYIKEAYPHYAWVGLVDMQGTIIQDADNLLVDATVAQRNWFTEGAKALYFGDAHEAILLAKLLSSGDDESLPLRLVDISAPIKGDNGDVKYVIGTHLSLEWAHELQRDMLLQLNDPDVEILVFNSDGNLILDSDFNSPDKQQDVETFFKRQLNDQASFSSKQLTWPDAENYLTVTVHPDEPVNSPTLGWSVVARKPISAVYQPASVIARQIVISSVIIFAAFMLLIWFAVKRSLKPLEELAELADRIRESEAHAAIPELEGNSEVARFSRSLTKLVNDLTHKNRELLLAERMFFDNSLAIMVTDAQRQIIRVNRAFSEFTGYSEEEALGNKPSILSSGRHQEEFYDDMNVSLREHGSWRGEIWNKHKSGRIYPEHLTIIALTDAQGEVTHYIAMFDDITEQKNRDKNLERLRNFDPLTKLPNREAGIRAVEKTLDQAAEEGTEVTLILIDIAGFKSVNEVHGHEQGDNLIKQVARRLNSVAMLHGYMSRWGGDEFLICARNCSRERAENIIERLMNAMTSPFFTTDDEQHLTIHCGVSRYPQDAEDAATLLRFADIALLESKKLRNIQTLFYSSDMNDSIVRHLEIENALRHSVEHDFDGFELFYQPQYWADSLTIKGFEALLRWRMGDKRPVPPDLFIPLAESNGLIEPIGEWVLKQACQTLKEFSSEYAQRLTMSVNVSGIQLQKSGFLDRLRSLVDAQEVGYEQLIIEVTETAFVANEAQANEVLADIRAAGFGVSIDDFGTGYASLDYIQRFRPTEIKVDQLFVQKMLTDEHCLNIVKFTLNLAESMKLEVVAEGVETQEQLDALKTMGKVIAQGYLLERPLPLDQLRELMSST